MRSALLELPGNISGPLQMLCIIQTIACISFVDALHNLAVLGSRRCIIDCLGCSMVCYHCIAQARATILILTDFSMLFAGFELAGLDPLHM